MGQEETISNSENEVQDDNTLNERFPMSKREYVRNKMEAMQKRIDELKEKVRNEGELLHSSLESNIAEGSLESNILDNKFQNCSDKLQNNLEQQLSENESGSDKSLYYSASNYSLCSLSTSSSDTAFNNFTKFVNNFLKNQNPKERLSLLQLHSKKQITLNMMRHSLAELDTKCAEELELIERSLRHLNKLAREFNVKASSDDETEGGKLKALEFHSSDSRERKDLKVRSNPIFIWPHEERKSRMNAICNPVFYNIDKQDKSTVRE